MRNKLVLLLMLVSVAFGYENCAMPGSGMSSASSNMSFTTSPTGVTPEALASTSTNVPYSLMSGDQLIRSMVSATGIQTPAPVQSVYAAQQTLGAGYDLHLMNGPMMVGITNVAYSACAQLVTEEQAMAGTSRKYFGLVAFTKVPSNLSPDDYNTTVNKLANGFWGRDATAEELQIMTDARTDYMAALTAAPTINDTLVISRQACTAVLSSFDAISL